MMASAGQLKSFQVLVKYRGSDSKLHLSQEFLPTRLRDEGYSPTGTLKDREECNGVKNDSASKIHQAAAGS